MMTVVGTGMRVVPFCGIVTVNTAVARTTAPEYDGPPFTVSGRMLSVCAKDRTDAHADRVAQAPIALAANFSPICVETVAGFSGMMTTTSRPGFRAWPGAGDSPIVREEGSYQGTSKAVWGPLFGPIAFPFTMMPTVGAGAASGNGLFNSEQVRQLKGIVRGGGRGGEIGDQALTEATCRGLGMAAKRA